MNILNKTAMEQKILVEETNTSAYDLYNTLTNIYDVSLLYLRAYCRVTLATESLIPAVVNANVFTLCRAGREPLQTLTVTLPSIQRTSTPRTR